MYINIFIQKIRPTTKLNVVQHLCKAYSGSPANNYTVLKCEHSFLPASCDSALINLPAPMLTLQKHLHLQFSGINCTLYLPCCPALEVEHSILLRTLTLYIFKYALKIISESIVSMLNISKKPGLPQQHRSTTRWPEGKTIWLHVQLVIPMTMHVYELHDYQKNYRFHYAWFVQNTAYSIQGYFQFETKVQLRSFSPLLN